MFHVVSFELHEAFRKTVALRAVRWRRNRHEAQLVVEKTDAVAVYSGPLSLKPLDRGVTVIVASPRHAHSPLSARSHQRGSRASDWTELVTASALDQFPEQLRRARIP